MTVSIISNQAATAARSALQSASEGSRIAINKVSSGQRVFSAEEDAAAIAIGAGLRMTTAGLQTASLNARSGVSMLQLADGAMSQLGDALTRMQSLAVQAASSQYSAAARATIDAEFQQIKAEVSRIVNDTEFNGTNLLAGGPLNTAIEPSSLSSKGISVFEYEETLITSDTSHRIEYDASTETMTLFRTEGATTTSQSIDLTLLVDDVAGAGENMIENENLYVNFNTVGLVLTLDNGFDRNTSFGMGAVVTTTAGDVTSTAASRAVDENISEAAMQALAALGTLNTTTGLHPVTLETDGANINVAGITGLRTAQYAVEEAATAATDGVSITAFDGGVVTGTATYRYSYDSSTEIMTLNEIDGGVVATQTVDVGALIDAAVTTAGTNLTGTQEVEVDFSTLGVTLTLDNSFVRGTDIAQAIITETIAGDVTVGTETLAFDTTNITPAAINALNSLGAAAVDLVNGTLDVTMSTDGANVTIAGIAGLKYSLNGGGVGLAGAATGNLTLGGPANTVDIYINDGGSDVQIATLTLTNVATTGATDRVIEMDFTKGMFAQTLAAPGVVSADGANSSNLALGTRTKNLVEFYINDGTSNVHLSTLDLANLSTVGATDQVLSMELSTGMFGQDYDPDNGQTYLTYMVGTGNDRDEDLIRVGINALNLEALGLTNLNVTTEANSNSSISVLADAISVLNTARAGIGAAQSRLELAASNLASALENNEIARSTLLDADTAKEITELTRQQLLMEASTSMLAQANSQPETLLRLLQ